MLSRYTTWEDNNEQWNVALYKGTSQIWAPSRCERTLEITLASFGVLVLCVIGIM